MYQAHYHDAASNTSYYHFPHSNGVLIREGAAAGQLVSQSIHNKYGYYWPKTFVERGETYVLAGYNEYHDPIYKVLPEGMSLFEWQLLQLGEHLNQK